MEEQPARPAAPGPDAVVTSGTVLVGRYRLDTRIGSGGSADVWRAHDQSRDRAVIVKLLRQRDDPKIRRRFLDEARRLTAVRHPGIVRHLGMHDALGHTFIVLELIEGPSLASVLEQRSFTPAETARIVLQLAKALEALHARGLVHLDLKPANILLGPGDEVRVIDLGIAGVIGSIPEVVQGTPRYVAPEVRFGEPLSPAADVYGLARVAAELLGERRHDPLIARVLRRSTDPLPARRHRRPRTFALYLTAAVVVNQERAEIRERGRQLAAFVRRTYRSATEHSLPADLTAMGATLSGTLRRRPAGIRRSLGAAAQRSFSGARAGAGAAGHAGPRAVLALACASVAALALAVPRLTPAAAIVELPVVPALARVSYALPPLEAYAAAFESQDAYPTVLPGVPVSWTVALRNTGSAGWQRGIAGAQASLALSDGTIVAVQTTPYVGPGQTGWFIARFRAPEETGMHVVPLRLVIEGAGTLPDLGLFALVTATN